MGWSRRRRAAKPGRLESLQDRQAARRAGRTIEVVFRLVGNYLPALDAAVQQQQFLTEVEAVQLRLAQSSTTGELDMLIGKQLLLTEDLSFQSAEFLCPPGSVRGRDGETCINCPVGTFYNLVVGACEACGPGSYQPEEAQDTCLVCPGGTATRHPGGVNQSQCRAQESTSHVFYHHIPPSHFFFLYSLYYLFLFDCLVAGCERWEQCRPGSHSRDGLESCRTCGQGKFQPGYAAQTCLSCPSGSSTLYRGAARPEDCLARCQPGSSSHTGLQPCYPCPPGHFQPLAGQDLCYRCPGRAATTRPAATSMAECLGLASSSLAWPGLDQLEVLGVNDCFSLPCHGAASCLPLPTGFRCLCPPSYQGSLCDSPVQPCLSAPCLNGATCSNLEAEYSCSCSPGYTGLHCEVTNIFNSFEIFTTNKNA